MRSGPCPHLNTQINMRELIISVRYFEQRCFFLCDATCPVSADPGLAFDTDSEHLLKHPEAEKPF